MHFNSIFFDPKSGPTHRSLHPNSHLYRSIFSWKIHDFVVTEYLHNGSVYDYIRTSKFNNSDVIRMGKDIAAGMAHLHMEGSMENSLFVNKSRNYSQRFGCKKSLAF